MSKQKTRIAVIGAGIAGLTAALALSKLGFRVSIFERNVSLQTTGTGIQLSCNAFKVLASLGLGESLRAKGFSPDAVHINSGTSGRSLSRFPLGKMIEVRHAAPYLVIHRADLANILMQACNLEQGIAIGFGNSLQKLQQNRSAVEFETDHAGNIKRHSADILIGADGVWSAVRKSVPHAAEPEFTGRIAWRAIIGMDKVSGALPRSGTGLWLGPNAHLVHYPLQGGKVMNAIAIVPLHADKLPRTEWIDDSPKEQRLQAFSGWRDELRQLIALDANWGGWPINAVARVGNWTNGRVGLIGDAAHAMVPFAAQGGAAAIEDAVVLANLCGQSPNDLPKALNQLGKNRSHRIDKIIRLSESNRRIYHMSGSKATTRNLALKAVPGAALQRRMDWLYGWEA